MKLFKNLVKQQQLQASLRTVATEEPSAALWERIQREVESLPAPSALPPQRRVVLRRAPVLAASVLLVGVGVGTVAAKQGWFGWRAPRQHQIGPFLLSGYYFGRVECYDASEALLAVQEIPAETVQGESLRHGLHEVKATVPGQLTAISQSGTWRYTLLDSTQKPIATLVLRPQHERNDNNPYMTNPPTTLTEARKFLEVAWHWQTTRWQTGTQSFDETPLGVTGYDCQLGLVWSLRGTAEISVVPANTKKPPTWTGTAEGFGGVLGQAITEYNAKHPLPEFNAIYQGNRFQLVGFGKHELRDPQGALALTVTITRPH